jgi:hypothetical protein
MQLANLQAPKQQTQSQAPSIGFGYAHSKNQARSAKAARNVDDSWFGYASSISDSSVITFQKQFHLKLRNTAIRKNVAMKSMPVAINAWW